MSKGLERDKELILQERKKIENVEKVTAKVSLLCISWTVPFRWEERPRIGSPVAMLVNAFFIWSQG